MILSQAEAAEEEFCSDEIEVVLVDNSGRGSTSAQLDDSDTVKIIITMSCDPQTAARLEESVKQSLLENVQVGIISQGFEGSSQYLKPKMQFDVMAESSQVLFSNFVLI